MESHTGGKEQDTQLRKWDTAAFLCLTMQTPIPEHTTRLSLLKVHKWHGANNPPAHRNMVAQNFLKDHMCVSRLKDP